jgi:uncharacterized protein YbjT (DUF2867 family)
MTRTILISGASGHLGRGVIHHLLESNGVPPECIVATTRTPEKLAGLPARGVVYDLGSNYFDERDWCATLRRSVQRLERLGYQVTVTEAA